MRYAVVNIAIVLGAVLSAEAKPATYFVAPGGSDRNDGTRERPFRTIQHAADLMGPGQTCVIRGGRYRQTVTITRSGEGKAPIVFTAAPGEKVVIDGTDLVTAGWTSGGGKIYKAKLTRATDQVFYKNNVMTPARWPDMTFAENWDDKKKWGRTGKGSDRGKIVSDDLAKLGESLVGAKVFVKIGKGNNCFSRDVVAHKAGSAELYWDDKKFYDDPKLTAEDGRSDRIKRAGLHNNRFFVRNHRALLNAGSEWYCDIASNELLLITPDGSKPASGQVGVKRRVCGFTGDNVANVELRGIEFFACTAYFTKARGLTLTGCRFLHPYELHNMRDNPQIREAQRPVFIQGENCVLRKCLVTYSPGCSLYVRGRGNRIENCIVTEGSRHGRHNDPNVTVHYDHRNSYSVANDAASKKNRKRWEYASQAGNVISHCTIYNCSGIGVYLLGRGPATAEYNHVFNVGLYCTDVSGLYIPLGRKRAWTGFHHNWIHDINGIGLRCDQDGDQVLFHHNVVWNCKAGGKANGFDFKIYNNTIFVNNPKHPLLMVKQKQVEVVKDWEVQNNAVFRLADRMDLREWKAMSRTERKKRALVVDIPDSPVIHHNHIIIAEQQDKVFVNCGEDEIDLRPAKNSPLIDKGVVVKGVTDGFKGKAPDIGAYEYGGTYWTAGADWRPDGTKPPQTTAQASKLAHQMTKGRRLYREDHDAYGNQ